MEAGTVTLRKAARSLTRPAAEPSPYLTVKETATAFRCSPMTVLRWIHAGDLPWVRAGRGYLVPRAFADSVMQAALTGGAVLGEHAALWAVEQGSAS